MLRTQSAYFRSARSILLSAAVAIALSVDASPAMASASKWTQVTISAATSLPLSSVACSGTGCVAMAEECPAGQCGGLLPGKAFSSSNDGASWTRGTFPSNDPIEIACGSPTFCVDEGTSALSISGTQVLATRDAGASWSVHNEPQNSFTADVCASATVCEFFGSAGFNPYTDELLRTTNSGASWKTSKFPGGNNVVASAACTTSSDCLAVGSNSTHSAAALFISANQGVSWQQVAAPKGTRALTGVSCLGLVCVAIATSAGQILVTGNGGKTWALHTFTMKSTGPQYYSAACLTGTECILVGSLSQTGKPSVPAAAISTNGGVSWTSQTLPNVDGSLTAIVCPTSARCLAVGAQELYSGSNFAGSDPLVLRYS